MITYFVFRGILNFITMAFNMPNGFEEVGLDISLENIIHEDSNIDNNKIFTRLVYSANLLQNENINIKLDPEEHVEYKWIKKFS